MPRRRARIRHHIRRVGRRLRRAAVKTSTMTKAINTVSLLIGASPAIVQAKNHLLTGDFQGFGDEIANLYSAGLTRGSFRWDVALEAYGPIIGAVAFKKGMSWLKKHTGKTLLG